MSNRECLGDVTNEDSPRRDGDRSEIDMVEVYRDNDTRSYRIFVLRGVEWADAHTGQRLDARGNEGAYRMDDCMCVDVSFEKLKALAEIINEAVRKHEPFINYAALEANESGD